MATTYSITTTFTADESAVASEVNQNFTDVLTALNAYDASNLSSGTVPLARISGLTTTQIAAATIVLEAEGIGSNDNDTTWPTSAAVKDAYDTAISTAVTGTGFWKTSGATVFNTTMTSAETFQDLDLSGTIGSNAGLCFLEVTANAGDIVIIRPKGYGGAWAAHHFVGSNGVGYVDFSSGSEFVYMMVTADSSGVIQIAASTNSTTITIKLTGYVK